MKTVERWISCTHFVEICNETVGVNFMRGAMDARIESKVFDLRQI